MTLTDKLNLLMKEKGITKMDLSRGSGIPYSTITSFYDKGTDNVKLSTLKKIAEFFDCSLDYLVDDSITEKKDTPQTIAAHYDGIELSEEEKGEIEYYIRFLISKRNGK